MPMRYVSRPDSVALHATAAEIDRCPLTLPIISCLPSAGNDPGRRARGRRYRRRQARQYMTILLSRIAPRGQPVDVHAPLGEIKWQRTIKHIEATLPASVPAYNPAAVGMHNTCALFGPPLRHRCGCQILHVPNSARTFADAELQERTRSNERSACCCSRVPYRTWPGDRLVPSGSAKP